MTVAHLRAFYTSRALRWLTLMIEYTHNDDVADLVYAKDQEIAVLKEALAYVTAELERLEKEHARGL
jgi:hypothetical protein